MMTIRIIKKINKDIESQREELAKFESEVSRAEERMKSCKRILNRLTRERASHPEFMR
jgi:CDP-glycerol glycerophosphotransferase (TagB/SpsB family)